jgi:adenylate kinase
MYNVSFLGAPGAGKGTQAAVVARRLNLAHIATGDMFRQAVEREDDLGKQVKGYLAKGELVPDRVTVRLVINSLKAADKRGAILDGFPRNIKQAEALEAAGGDLHWVVYLPVAEEELVQRLSGRRVCRNCETPYKPQDGAIPGVCESCGGELYQRPDDNPEMIKKRLKVYHAETEPLVGYYREKGKLVEVRGEGDTDAVTGRIIAALGKRGLAE